MNSIAVTFPEAKPYLTTGSRAYVIGGQDGSFPERGEHMPKEMYGIWAPPIKAADGFWLKVNGSYLPAGETFEMLPWGCRFYYPVCDEISTERFQFVPDETEGVCVTYTFHNTGTEAKQLPICFTLKSDLQPVWLSDRLGKENCPDIGRFDASSKVLTLKDQGNPWYLLMTASLPAKGTVSHCSDAPEQPSGQGIWASLSLTLSLKPQETKDVSFFLVFSSCSETEALKTLQLLSSGSSRLLEKKIKRYEQIDAHATLELSNASHLAEMYHWTKYNNDWAVREVPGIGRGAVAGYAEFPWWFGHDSTYLLKSFLLTGDYELCRSTSRLIRDMSDRVNGNGRVIHEGVSNGIVFYEGMISETPQFAEWIYNYYCWTGDREFLMEFYPFLKKGMEWVLSESVDGLPYGYGALEIGGFDCMVFDCAVDAVRGYEVLAKLAAELGFSDDAARFHKQFEESLSSFNRLFWLEDEGRYADMAGTREEILERTRSWKISLKSFPAEEEDGIYGDESCNFDKTPEDLEVQRKLRENLDRIASEAAKMNDTERRAFCFFGSSSAGLLLEKGYLPAERARCALGNEVSYLSKPSENPYGDMGIGTSRIMRRFAAEGNADELWNALQSMYRSFGAVCPGATPEYFPGKGCFCQIWNNEATMSVYTECVLGIHPDAAHKRLVLRPCVPEQLGRLQMKNVSIGSENFDFDYLPEKKILTVSAPAQWDISLEHPEIVLNRQSTKK